MKEKRNRKSRAKRIILTVVCISQVLLLMAIVCVILYVNHMLNKINRVDPDLEYTLSSSEADSFLADDTNLVTLAPGNTETYVKLEDLTFPTSPLNPTESPVPPTEPPTTPPTEPPTTPPTEPPTTPPTESPTTPPTEPPTTPPTTKPENPTPSLDTVYGDHLVNILLIGQDRRQGQGRQRSDSMILVSINKSNSTITLTSFMRDQYVRIPGYNPNKLNAAYAFGGMKLLAQTLELNFGVKVDGMIEVDFSGFENIITLLGGVKVTLTKAEAKYLNDLYDVRYLDSPVVVGENLLNAKQALVYVGLREIDTDYHRASRQRNVIIGLIEAYRDLPLDKMLSLLDEILPLITTDMSNAKILNYAMACFPMLSTAKIQTLRIPLEGTFIGGLVEVREGFYGWFQYNIDFEANKKALFEVFRRRD